MGGGPHLPTNTGYQISEIGGSEPERALDLLAALSFNLSDSVEEHRVNENAISWLKQCFRRYESTRDTVPVVTRLAAVDKEFVGHFEDSSAFFVGGSDVLGRPPGGAERKGVVGREQWTLISS